MIFTVHQAKTQLSKLIARAEAGEEVIIARGDKPAVKLTPVAEGAPKPRQPGAWKGRFELPDGFFDPLPENELGLWEGADD
jgi:prevent-host-death family protein